MVIGLKRTLLLALFLALLLQLAAAPDLPVVTTGYGAIKRLLFNLEHLLSEPIPELIGSGINLCVQLSVQHGSFD